MTAVDDASRTLWGRFRFVFLGAGAGLVVTLALLTTAGEGPFARDRVETVPWGTAVVAEDERSITVSFVGAVEFPEDDPCHVDYSATVDEDADGVVITVEGRESGGSKSCTLAGLSRQLTVPIAGPLDGRPVIDGHDGRINQVRAANGDCLQARVRPEPSAPEVGGASSTSTVAPPPPTDPCDG